MIITTKYRSKCPACNEIITKGSQAHWEKGSNPIHIECKHISVEEIEENYQESHPAFDITYIGLIDNNHHFEATNPKTGAWLYAIFSKAGTVQHRLKKDYMKVIVHYQNPKNTNWNTGKIIDKEVAFLTMEQANTWLKSKAATGIINVRIESKDRDKQPC